MIVKADKLVNFVRESEDNAMEVDYLVSKAKGVGYTKGVITAAIATGIGGLVCLLIDKIADRKEFKDNDKGLDIDI